MTHVFLCTYTLQIFAKKTKPDSLILQIQSNLRGFRVMVDEQDLSTDSAFMEELQRILNIYEKTKLTLPRVFISGRYIGSAEEVRQRSETAKLKKFLEGLPAAKPGVCEGCGDYKFILYDECSGSHKCYTEKISGFRSCIASSENVRREENRSIFEAGG